VNFTPGTCTFDDYTTPDMGNYRSSQELIDALMNYEQKNTLDGCIILIHPGTNPKRTDKLYHHLDELINLLSSKGYTFDKLK
jgi:peptidoglycan/xylan/chitin deacetylase (PgdA/CDA1 family)